MPRLPGFRRASELSVSLEDDVAFLELENAFLLGLLERVAPGAAARPTPAAAVAKASLLLLPEKQELCVAEAAAVRREIDRIKEDCELERACAEAGIADARNQQAAETARDLASLLALLGLPAPPAAAAAEAIGAAVVAATATPLPGPAAQAGPAESAAEVPVAAGQADATQPAGNTGVEPAASRHRSSVAAVTALALPSARQLGRADFNGARLAHFLEEVLARHDAARTRLQSRNAVLQGQLSRVEAALGARAELGEALRKVDFDALRIEHSQAEMALSAASADAVALKAQVATAAQRLAEQRAALAATSAESTALAKQTGVREGQAGVLRGEAARARRECEALERECRRLREHQRGGSAGGGSATEGPSSGRGDTKPPAGGKGSSSSSSSVEHGSAATILEYMQLKNALAETTKRIADWQRKLEVQAGRRGRCVAASSSQL